jgi:hypothetical protein
MVAVIISLFAASTGYVLLAYSSELTTLDLTTEFLSSVVGIDMTKYTLSPPPTGYENIKPPNDHFKTATELADIEFHAPSFDFNSTEGTLETMSGFRYGHLTFLNVYSQDNYVYSESPPTDILNQAKSILQRYQTFVTKVYAKDNSFLVPMQTVLNSLNYLSPTNTTIGNINFQVSKDGDKTRIQWIYTENGVSMSRKRVELEFRKNTFVSFTDSWSLYKVGGLSVISSEEAVAIALEAAQKVELHIGHADGTNETVKVPDLSNAHYDVSFTMIPYRNLSYNIPSKMARDPSTLYPYWQFHFYFNESIAGNIGVQVGVWGDTGEIVYASGYGFLGGSDISNGELPSDQALDEQEQPNQLDPSTLAVAITLAAVMTISIAAVALRHKNRHKQQV